MTYITMMQTEAAVGRWLGRALSVIAIVLIALWIWGAV